jgi:hypothetical protein
MDRSMILETICKRGHIEHVQPAVYRPDGVVIWGSAADFCDRILKDHRRCEAVIISVSNGPT